VGRGRGLRVRLLNEMRRREKKSDFFVLVGQGGRRDDVQLFFQFGKILDFSCEFAFVCEGRALLYEFASL
tara:strand:- start:304 stop:513 length:210 start_codon:yes stop_codon:yes gene_type:complete